MRTSALALLALAALLASPAASVNPATPAAPATPADPATTKPPPPHPESRSAIKEAFGSYVIDRKTGKQFYEEMPTYLRFGMKALFGAKGVVSSKLIRATLKSQTLKRGIKYNSEKSAAEIPDFVKQFDLNLGELLEPDVTKYKTYNEFFYRKLKPDARPIASPTDPTVLVSAADCRLNVFETINLATQVWIKGSKFNLENLLQDKALATTFDGGSIAIFRLAPQDYHRFHSPVEGTIEAVKPIDGTYYTVNPMAVKTKLDVFTENKRIVTIINSPTYGKVAFVSIGAMMVGSIELTGAKVGNTVKKGDELGYFAFGGSTVVTVFEKDKVRFDKDLEESSKNVIETLVRMGEQIRKKR